MASVPITGSVPDLTEAAVAAFIRGTRDANADSATTTSTISLESTRSGSLNGLIIQEGRTTQARTYPSAVVEAQARQEFPGEEVYLATVRVRLETHRHESAGGVTRAEVKHKERADELAALLRDEAALRAGLNAPLHGTDSRDVTGFSVQALLSFDHNGQAAQDLLEDIFTLDLVVYPFDAAGV